MTPSWTLHTSARRQLLEARDNHGALDGALDILPA